MKKWIYPILGVLGFLVLATGIYLTYQAAQLRVGVVDTEKVMKDSAFSKKLSDQIQAKQNDLGAQLQAAVKANDQEKAEKLKAEYSSFVESKNKEFMDRVNEEIKQVALKNKLKAVFPTTVVSYAQDKLDITKEVTDALD